MIARHGIAGVTHRRVAAEAKVSLAATTYHYQTKLDIIADASSRLLEGYTGAFRSFLDRHPREASLSFRDFAMRVAIAAAGRHRVGSLAWCEIILDAARHPETRDIARDWFETLLAIWTEIAVAFDVPDPRAVATSAIDTVIGLLFVIVPLGLDEAKTAGILLRDEAIEGGDEAGDRADALISPPPGRKAGETRRRIVAAATEILASEGTSGVTYRAVAQRAGITASAPIYHFPSIDHLLDAAQARLFDASKDRYRTIMSSVDHATLDIARLTDLTTAVFLREATEFAAVSVASYPIWLDAARNRSLRPTIRATIEDQNHAWDRLLRGLLPTVRPNNALLIQSLFRGKLIRILATGAATADLAAVRSSFDQALRGLDAGTFWALR